MIIILLFILICIIIFISFFGDEISCYGYWDDWLQTFLFFIVLLFSIVFFGTIGALVSFSLPAKTKPESDFTNLVSLNDGVSIGGSFFLGSGSINGKMKYTYYYESAPDVFKMGQINYDKAAIVYDNNPRLETITDEPTDSWINLFAMDGKHERYIFHIPFGTIKNDFILDGK